MQRALNQTQFNPKEHSLFFSSEEPQQLVVSGDNLGTFLGYFLTFSTVSRIAQSCYTTMCLLNMHLRSESGSVTLFKTDSQRASYHHHNRRDIEKPPAIYALCDRVCITYFSTSFSKVVPASRVGFFTLFFFFTILHIFQSQLPSLGESLTRW